MNNNIVTQLEYVNDAEYDKIKFQSKENESLFWELLTMNSIKFLQYIDKNIVSKEMIESVINCKRGATIRIVKRDSERVDIPLCEKDILDI